MDLFPDTGFFFFFILLLSSPLTVVLSASAWRLATPLNSLNPISPPRQLRCSS
ncbi:hypothetical protein BO79DRAFT_58103 [Aspergillus costaricaensis CBS 115574]|uniref:Uncharacterized protein n=1 Tax=Aspergillus costaricaensis CBS 115574 TaxID=1448317 RepID=A0ACD1I176_9EURO|nr:hypothetical protein BO79DRAFT_58103 [Aspergillus costaricaensis CBS 115574]RAK84331.1 hypothetical protein BO79DRAFT_58103 [Aspergillus costaricaensis CBS 115574]